MVKEIIMYGDIEFKKHKLHYYKGTIILEDV